MAADAIEGTLSKPAKHNPNPNFTNLIFFMTIFLLLTLAESDFWLDA